MIEAEQVPFLLRFRVPIRSLDRSSCPHAGDALDNPVDAVVPGGTRLTDVARETTDDN